MKKTTFFKTMLLATVMLVGSANVWAETGKLTITRSNFPSGSLAYGTDDLWTVTTSDGTITGYFDIYSTAGQTTMQTRTNSPIGSYPYNVDAIPGAITKITLTEGGTGTARAWTPYLSSLPLTKSNFSTAGTSQGAQTAASTSASTVWNVSATDNYTYFYLNMTGGAAYLNSIEIEYEIGGAVCTPSTLSFSIETLPKSVTDAAFTQTASSLNTTTPVAYESSNPAVATVNATTGAVTIVGAGSTTISATQAADIHSGTDYCAGSDSYMLTVTGLSAPVATSATSPTSSSFTANWNAVTGATGYVVEVYTGGTNFEETFAGFSGTGGNDGGWTGSVAGSRVDEELPGWTFSSNTSGVLGFIGNNCLKLGTGNDLGTATTPELGLSGNATLSFRAGAWNGGSEQTELLLEISGGGALSESSVTMTKGAFSSHSIDIIGGTATTKISFKGKQASNSRFFLDDVKVAAISSVTGSPFTVGAVTSLEITGLSAETTYYYTVTTTNGSFTSDKSNEITAVTLEEKETGNNNTQVPSFKVSTYNGTLLVEGVAAGNTIEVYNTIGQLLTSAKATNRTTTIDVPARGIVLVKVDKQLKKVVL